jgi:hypothetical protein
LSQALTRALPTTLTAALPLRWEITSDTPLQRLLEQAQASVNQLDSADHDTESTEFQEALAQQRNFDHTFLLGLDIAPSAPAMRPQSASERSRIDSLLRRTLTQANVPFQVLYGLEDERLRHALTALQLAEAKPETAATKRSSSSKPWVWTCDKCSDPACEHRLLSDLLLNR